MKEFIEIPFGAKDSELGGWEYNIPEGYTASIENGKIIVKKEESDDERIRKELVFYLGDMPEDTELRNGVTNRDVLAWLEKQGEQNLNTTIPKFKEGETIIHKDLGGDYIHNPHKIIQVDVLENKYRLEGGLVAHFSEQDDYELVAQKPAWREEDERMRKTSIRACQHMVENFENSTLDYEDAIDWLNSLKNRVQPQWKPSDEQLRILLNASNGNYMSYYYRSVLGELYRNLKQL